MVDRDAEVAESHGLARMIISIAERAKADFGEAVAPFGLPVPVVRALVVLREPAPMREIARELACDPSYITGIADQLEQNGLVTRVQGRDRRVKLLQLTAEGVALREEISAVIAETVAFAQELDPAERATLAELLARLVK